ncbi:MAG TPA: pyruvate ferredoxin oxidoreductase subunit gamma [Methanocorpusculum sp.]|nr:pyruvate ferredoxin oxidoreductase subunit gamma [Methanocorpusculum sp.]
MRELRIYGRGGQGSVTAAELIAIAAFNDGRYSQAFPAFGVERRGAPVQAFVRFSDEKIRLRSQVYTPNYVIIQDSTLIRDIDVFAGLVNNGIVIINTEKSTDYNLNSGVKLITIDATKIAMDTIGRPITNTTLIGAFAGASKEVTLESIKYAIKCRFPEKIADSNYAAAEIAYNMVLDGDI